MKTILTVFLTSVMFLGLHGQTIVPTQTDEIIIDNGASGKADPNDRIRYKVTIQNTGGASGTGVQLNAVPDPRTTFVPGSFRSSPLAVADAYTATGNVPINVPAGSGVKTNDFDDNLGLATLSCGTCLSANNGTIVLNNDGSFTYTPPAGFTGSDNFTYTMTDGNPVGLPVPLTDVATVTITVANLIWFIDNSAAAGDGRRNTPFNSLAAFNAGSAAAGDVVYVEHTGTNYTGGITLQNNERLFGEGHTGGANLSNVLPFVLAPHSVALPAINGTKPVIAASVTGITLANNNTVRGMAVSGGTNSALGTNTASLLFQENDLSGASGDALKLTSATGTVSILNNTISAGMIGTSVTSTAGALSLDMSNNAYGTTGTGISVNGTGGALTITGFANNTVSGNTTGTGITINTARFDATAGGAFDPVSGGTTVIGQSGNGVGASGFLLTNVTGDLSFADLDIFNDGGTGLSVSSTGAVNIGAGTGFRIAVSAGVSSIDSNGGPSVNVNNASITLPVNFLRSTNSTTTGVSLVNAFGGLGSTALSAATGQISDPVGASGTAVNISGGNGNISLSIPITSTSGNAVVIASRSSDMITFSGAINETGSGISMTGNTGATMNFTGGLTISTGANPGFSATGGGTVNVTGASNTITTTSGTALNIANTTIGASNLTFLSISANGAPNGIVLNTTGGVGGLSVTGTGTTNGSGGTIQNITNRGVSATSTINLSLKNMAFTSAATTDASPCGAADNSGCNAAIYLNTVTTATLDNVDVTNSAQQGINLREVNGFQLLGSTVINTGAGGQTEEAGLYALNLFGTCAITNSSLTFSTERTSVIYNTSKTLALTVTGSTFGETQAMALGADAFEISSFGASNTTLDIVNCTFTKPKTNGLQVITENTSHTSVDVTGSTFDSGVGLAAAIDLVTNNTGDMDFNIVNNPLIKANGINVVNVFAFPNSTFEGRINNNTITSAGGSGSGVRVISQGNGNSRVEVKNNIISGISLDFGMDLAAQLGTGRLDAIITGNNISIGPAAARCIRLLAGGSGSAFTNKFCGHVANNTTTAPAGSIGHYQARAEMAAHEMLLQGAGGTVGANWDANLNTPTVAGGAVISQSGTGIFTFGATCNIPANPNP